MQTMVAKAAAMAAVMVVAAVGVASMASADKDDGKEHKDGFEEKFIYVNGGVIGDNINFCRESLSMDFPEEVAMTPVPVVGGETLVDETLNVCLGGAVSFDDGAGIADAVQATNVLVGEDSVYGSRLTAAEEQEAYVLPADRLPEQTNVKP